MSDNDQIAWQRYKEKELNVIEVALQDRGYSLDSEQPHTAGERFLMQAVTTTSGQKLILLGYRTDDDLPVIIKATSDPAGKAEIAHEQQCRNLLPHISFAYNAFHAPTELESWQVNGLLISVQEKIEQPCTFLERPLSEQFEFALKAFKTQEGAHATTRTHYTTVARHFGIKESAEYLQSFGGFVQTAETHDFQDVAAILRGVLETLTQQQKRIGQYCGFLTHTDFVPHNFRIRDDVMYLLDFSALRFGNKHEGWARFLNFMTLYNPALEKAFLLYIRENRSKEEQESLHLMRLYRLGEIIHYYISKLDHCEGDLKKLNRLRVDFWLTVLKAEIKGETLNDSIRKKYQADRNSLRSEDEKKRQVGLH